MAFASRLSNAVRITDVNDFLTPSAACVLPLGGGALPQGSARVNPEPPGSVLAPIIPQQPSANSSTTTAKVTLSDCLTCSGCVTSAETVLLSTQSLDELRSVMAPDSSYKATHFALVALSQQAVASIALHYALPLQLAARKLCTFLRTAVGFDAVVDLSFARHFALLEASAEFIHRYNQAKGPLITSACPGWLTYAEKTQTDSILQYVSHVRSPQAILPLLANSLLSASSKAKAWIAAVAPCHDKKLEASRPEFQRSTQHGDHARELDCVLTASELVELLNESRFDLVHAEESSFNHPLDASSLTDHFGVSVGSPSGGFADFILRRAAHELLGVRLADGPLQMEKASKSGDLRTVTVKSADGAEQLRFATAYGFRSLQSVLRKMRRGECAYDYVELMACPGGCNNGGGLLEPTVQDEESGKSARQLANEHLQRVNDKFAEALPVSDPLDAEGVKKVYRDVVGGLPGSEASKKVFSISVQSRKTSVVTPSSLSW